MSRLILSVLVCLVMSSFVGCAPDTEPADREARVSATVTVTYNGAPVEGANVTLYPTGDGTAAFCMTGAGGKADLTTYDSGDGAIPGEYTVAVQKTEAPEGGEEEGDEESDYEESEDGSVAEVEAKDLLPAKYKDPATSGLTATVEPGGSDFTFELTDE